jgi:hypothetical protein
VDIRQLEESRDCIDAIDPLKLRASSVHLFVIGVGKSNIRVRLRIHSDYCSDGWITKLEMRVDHADERLELFNIDGNSGLKLLP